MMVEVRMLVPLLIKLARDMRLIYTQRLVVLLFISWFILLSFRIHSLHDIYNNNTLEVTKFIVMYYTTIQAQC